MDKLCLVITLLLLNAVSGAEDLQCYVCIDCDTVEPSQQQTCTRPIDPTTEAPSTDITSTDITSTNEISIDTTTPSIDTPATAVPETDATTTEAPETETTITTPVPDTTTIGTTVPDFIITGGLPTLPPIDVSTTGAPVTEASTIEETSTDVPMTEASTTQEPTTNTPLTEASTTEEPTTNAPITEVSTTEESTTNVPTTETSITEEPTTVTEPSTTEEATTEATVTEISTTEEPTTTVTEPSTTEDATTDATVTEVPITEEPNAPVPGVLFNGLPAEDEILLQQIGQEEPVYKVEMLDNGRSKRTLLRTLREIKNGQTSGVRCIVTSFVDDNKTRVVRGCSFASGSDEDRCREVIGGNFSGNVKRCNVCQGNLCNSAATSGIALAPLLIAILFSI